MDLALICIPLYNETLRDCFTVGEKKKYQKIDDNGELVIEWKKEKSIQCEDFDEDTGEKEYTMLWKQK